MSYISGFVAAVPADNKEVYRKHAADAVPLFREFGITRTVENWGDDVPDGKQTDFKRAVKSADGEETVFSWFEHPSKESAGTAHEKMMSDPRMQEMGATMPFDGMRMIFGGFSTLVDEGPGGNMGYVDGAVIPVPADKQTEFADLAGKNGKILLDHGATRIVDAWGDFLPEGKVTDFQGAVNLNDGETIVFAWIEWPSKEVRDHGWEKIMTDSRMQMDGPEDMQRAIFGGFVPILDE